MMAIRCPNCSQIVQVPSADVGAGPLEMTLACPTCHEIIGVKVELARYGTGGGGFGVGPSETK